MIRSRLLVLSCAMASVVACSDATTVPNPGAILNPPATPIGPQYVELRGVVEILDDARFGLRQADEVVVALRYSDTDALMTVVGREVILRGTFTAEGDFSVAILLIPEDGEDAYFRAPAVRQSGQSGKR